MGYPITNLILALWALVDGFSRKIGWRAPAWALGSLLFGPFVFPFYYARRPLKEGESREGGSVWNGGKWFVLCWALLCGEIGFRFLFRAADLENRASAGTTLGILFALGILAAMWLVPSIGALVIGLFFKRGDSVERGPSGPLASTPGSAEAFAADRRNRRAVIVTIIALASLIILVLLSPMLLESLKTPVSESLKTVQTPAPERGR